MSTPSATWRSAPTRTRCHRPKRSGGWRTRGWPPPSKDQFLRETGPDGAWHVGSPESVARKIAANLPALGASRFDLKYGMVGLPHETIMRTIELYGTKVVPLVRDMFADMAKGPAA